MTTLVGFGSHGQDILRIWNEVHAERPLRLTDDDRRVRDAAPVGTIKLPREPDDYYLGPYYPLVRRGMAKRLGSQWTPAEPLIFPNVHPGPGCLFAGGVVVAQNAVLDHSVHLGLHTHVNYSVSMTRTTIGDFCTISPGVVICGDVRIGNEVFIGAGATIVNLLTIGDGVFVSAGATVRQNVEPGERVR